MVAEKEAKNDTSNNAPQFAIERIYVNDLSFESPKAVALFTGKQAWKPQVNLDMQTNSKKISDNEYEVELHGTVTANVEDETAFVVDIKQAGIFRITNLKKEELDHALGAFCPQIIFPYLREAVSEVVTRGGFPPFYLTPINFEAAYAQQQAKK